MELLEAILGMFGDSIISGYFNLIEKSLQLNEQDANKKKIRLKRIISAFAGTVFLLAFVSLMLCFLTKGIFRNICLLIFLICFFVFLTYILLGYILTYLYNRKNKKQ